MSILDKVKIGYSVQVNLELSKDRLTKETIDAINVSSLGKISDFRITDGKGIGVVLQPVSYTHLTLPTTPYV